MEASGKVSAPVIGRDALRLTQSFSVVITSGPRRTLLSLGLILTLAQRFAQSSDGIRAKCDICGLFPQDLHKLNVVFLGERAVVPLKNSL